MTFGGVTELMARIYLWIMLPVGAATICIGTFFLFLALIYICADLWKARRGCDDTETKEN